MSTPGNDRTTDAVWSINSARGYSVDEATAATVEASLAVAAATLALAEEQRTANLIAWHLHLCETDALPNEVEDTARMVEERLGLREAAPAGSDS